MAIQRINKIVQDTIEEVTASTRYQCQRGKLFKRLLKKLLGQLGMHMEKWSRIFTSNHAKRVDFSD